MKRRLYIYSIWVAVMGMLLSTMMLHHHHYERICMVLEECSLDGCFNDEHTDHHDTDHDGCQLKQMQHFLVKNRVEKSIDHLLLDGSLQAFVIPVEVGYVYYAAQVAVDWQMQAAPLPSTSSPSINRRGPPLYS